MSWSNRHVSVRRGRKRFVGLNARGETEPEVYQVANDVFGIVGKMLSANQALGPYSGCPLFEFSEVRFILRLLGVFGTFTNPETVRRVDLWISDD